VDNGTIMEKRNGGVGFFEMSQQPENSFFLYPNPANTFVFLETWQLDKNCTLSIFNLSGMELISHPIKENKTQIDISKLKSGIYFIKVRNGNTATTRKIVKL
jgi:hypothetical protein